MDVKDCTETTYDKMVEMVEWVSEECLGELCDVG